MSRNNVPFSLFLRRVAKSTSFVVTSKRLRIPQKVQGFLEMLEDISKSSRIPQKLLRTKISSNHRTTFFSRMRIPRLSTPFWKPFYPRLSKKQLFVNFSPTIKHLCNKSLILKVGTMR